MLSMPKTVTVCFAKTPGLTPAKTRLASDIGEERCHQLYRLMVERCRELMMQLEDFHPHVAVNEKEAVQSPYWRNLATYVQGQGDLGDKLAHAENFFFEGFEQVIFWGTDSPALTIRHFHLVRESLETMKAAIIPALDGGFAVYGANSKISTGSWNKIHYSTSSTCQELLIQLGPGVFLAPAISDLDTVRDVSLVVQQMEEVSSQGPAWDELLAFLKKI